MSAGRADRQSLYSAMYAASRSSALPLWGGLAAQPASAVSEQKSFAAKLSAFSPW